MRSSWLYFATRSVRLADPVLICPALVRDGEIGDRRVLGFAGSMRDDARVAGVARHRDRVERFGDRADLIQLDEQRVADVLADAAPQDLGVGDEHVVADQLHARRRARWSAPSSRPSRLRRGRLRSR